MSLGPSGFYKSFIRIITNPNSEVETPNAWVEVLPGSEKVVEFNWKSRLPDNFDPEKYKIYFRKQAGIDEFPFNLTVGGKTLYNEPLGRDLFYERQKTKI